MSKKERPKIGIATIVKAGGLFLIGERINSHGHQTMSFPGGHLESFESFIECAGRKLKEETGLIKDKDVKYLSEIPIATTNDFFKEENKHYVTLFMIAEQISGNMAKRMEPKKTKFWEYAHWDNIIEYNYQGKLFLPIHNLLIQGFNPYTLKF